MSYDRRPQSRPVRQVRRASPIKTMLAIIIAGCTVIALFLAGIAAEQYNNGNRSPAAAVTVTAATTAPGERIGDKARDGRFEFVVSGVDCSRTTIGVEHLKRTADGRFCVVSLTVRNVGDDSRFLVGRAQRAFGDDGTAYETDGLAGLYANRDAATFLQRLAPGDRVAGKLVFDVPEQVALTSLELHDSLLSGGVTVRLDR
ncbi:MULTISPECIES: DUF4352 domain-containing protein [Actinoplanes]|uniref:DUF4352 domain-containing protein n=1 Tax=Actinoplanes TaxID=1865 RepID=UPI000B20A3AA|nr:MULTISPECIES: DUF4352 domain-containing protein [Actinoplanes]GLY08157.1 hypothetical protein Acsp01_85360 [Actinoplanes sp. NBRC 101535]